MKMADAGPMLHEQLHKTETHEFDAVLANETYKQITRGDMDRREKALAQKRAKPPIYQGLLAYFPRALREVAKVSRFGSEKHDTPMSEKGFLGDNYPTEGYVDAVGRHILDRAIEGEINEADGGQYHLAQVAWDALAALERVLIEKEDI